MQKENGRKQEKKNIAIIAYRISPMVAISF